MQKQPRYFKLVLEYDGTDFHGWQIQPELRTVQGALIEALTTITRSEVTVHGASRTDRGVHAYGQVARAIATTRIPIVKLRAALNNVLPEDVRVVEAAEVDEDYHPRFQAKGKHYRYLLLNQRYSSPLLRRCCWHRHQELDIEAMHEAAQALVGEHDFASFAPAREERSTVREMFELAVSRLSGGPFVAIDVAGDGFLWNMVRTFVGTLVEVGRGALAASSMGEIIEARNRRRAGPTAPPQGLFLVKIFYDEAPHITAWSSRFADMLPGPS